MIAGFAVVTKVLPERYGVLVRFSGGMATYDMGDENSMFVRVLTRRAHPAGGAVVDLPQVGELGLVVDLEDGHQIWMGSIHWEDTNWVDPTINLLMERHTSGVVSQIRKNGDMQLSHPSGLRVTIAEAQGALPDLQREGDAALPPKGPCVVEIEHPSGTTIQILEGGRVVVSANLVEVAAAVSINGTLGVSTGASGTFGALSGETVTVQNGVVTNIF